MPLSEFPSGSGIVNPGAANTRLVRVCRRSDVAANSGKSFKLGSLRLAIFHSDGRLYATNDICSHEHEHLSEGWLEGDVIECPRHGAQFNIKTGAALTLPATKPIEVYRIELQGDDVMVAIPEEYLKS